MIKLRKWIKTGIRGPEGSGPQKSSMLVEKEAKKIKVIYETKGMWNIAGESDFEEIEVPTVGQNLEPGEPALPQEGIYVALPAGATVSDIKVIKTEKKTIKLNKKLKPAPTPTLDEHTPPEYIPNSDIYERDEVFPGVLYKDLGMTKLGDVNVLHLMICPVQYYPRTNKVDLYQRIELEISYEAETFRGAPTRGGRKRVPPGYEDQILNFDNV